MCIIFCLLLHLIRFNVLLNISVYTFKNCDELNYLNIYRYFNDTKAVLDLAKSLQMLALQNSEKLLLLYKRSFLTHGPVAKFCLDIDNPLTQFCAVLPKYRNNTKLNNNFNDLEITLLQILPPPLQRKPQQNAMSSPAVQLRPELDLTLHQSGEGGGIDDDASGSCSNVDGKLQMVMMKHQNNAMKKIEYFTLKSQHGYGITYILRYVDIIGVERRECYHLAQRFNSNPIWIAGQSYQKSIYN